MSVHGNILNSHPTTSRISKASGGHAYVWGNTNREWSRHDSLTITQKGQVCRWSIPQGDGYLGSVNLLWEVGRSNNLTFLGRHPERADSPWWCNQGWGRNGNLKGKTEQWMAAVVGVWWKETCNKENKFVEHVSCFAEDLDAHFSLQELGQRWTAPPLPHDTVVKASLYNCDQWVT